MKGDIVRVAKAARGNCLNCALRDANHLAEPCWSCRRVDGVDTNWRPRPRRSRRLFE